MTHKRIKIIGFLAFNGIQALDLFGPLDAFAEANHCQKGGTGPYKLMIISEDGAPVTTESGVVIQAHAAMHDCPALHTLIIPGGAGTRRHFISEKIIDWIEAQAKKTARICSVCTGLFILARTGLLDGRTVATHWEYVQEAQRTFPSLRVNPDALFIRDDKFITAAGITAGIDMALALVEEDLGPDVASLVARRLVVFLRRTGGQNQFSSFLRQQAQSSDQFANLIAWIADNLAEDLSTERLASRVCLSERHFRRKFKQVYGETPSRNVERIRIEVAKDWLQTTKNSVEQISLQTGYTSPDSFRRAFERLTGTNPTEYRSHFGHFS